MRTREDAGGPGALGRVRTIWRVALGDLWLAVRALAARAGLTLALTALTAFAVGVAAAGAMYLRAAGESLLQDRLAATSLFSAGLLVERKVATSTEVKRLQQLLRQDPRLAVPALTPPLFGLESEGFLTYSRPGNSDGPRAPGGNHPAGRGGRSRPCGDGDLRTYPRRSLVGAARVFSPAA
jgi:hypothetical protein